MLLVALKETRMVKKALVRVKVYRTFEYPKSMLHKDFFMGDAINKSRNDMQVFIDEVIHNDHARVGEDMFQYEAEEYLGYKYRMRQPEDEKNGDNISLAKVVKVLTTQRMEVKHGPLNHETNPGLFENVPEIRSKDGATVIREETWYFREPIEKEFYAIYDEYMTLLKNS